MNASAPLQGLRVLVTRPAAQADALCRLLEARGAQVQRLPLQVIEPVRQPARAARALAGLRDATAWIFTSANAVRYAQQLDAGVWPATIAVGAATAAALERLGHAPLVPAQDFSTEGLLEMPELQDLAGRRVAVISGEGGREALAPALRARGAEVERIAVYRRVPLPHDADAVARALAQADALIVTGGEALVQLLQLAPAAERPRLLGLQLVVPSRRVVEQARQLGFGREPLVPDQVADAAFVRCLEAWRRADNKFMQ